jgi:hypothetical protein
MAGAALGGGECVLEMENRLMSGKINELIRERSANSVGDVALLCHL